MIRIELATEAGWFARTNFYLAADNRLVFAHPRDEQLTRPDLVTLFGLEGEFDPRLVRDWLLSMTATIDELANYWDGARWTDGWDQIRETIANEARIEDENDGFRANEDESQQ